MWDCMQCSTGQYIQTQTGCMGYMWGMEYNWSNRGKINNCSNRCWKPMICLSGRQQQKNRKWNYVSKFEMIISRFLSRARPKLINEVEVRHAVRWGVVSVVCMWTWRFCHLWMKIPPGEGRRYRFNQWISFVVNAILDFEYSISFSYNGISHVENFHFHLDICHRPISLSSMVAIHRLY